MKVKPSIDELKERRLDILNLFNHAKTNYVRRDLHYKLKSINRDLFTITKNTIYL
jgi:hypothetical protein